MADKSIQEHVSIGHYAVAFIDLLSQKDRLAKLRELPQNDAQLKVFITNLKESVGVVDMFRKAMITSIGVIEAPLPNSAMANDPRFSRIWSDVHKIKINHKFFSDCLVLWVPLASDQNGIPVAAVFHLMQSVSQLFSIALSLGYTCRGGIDVGVAGEFFDGELYGPALSNAYLLESVSAIYPRIVIGPSLQEYLDAVHKSSQESREFTVVMRREFSQFGLDLIAVDQDGQMILDYFGIGSARSLDGNSLGLYQKSLAFCFSQLVVFSDAANGKLLDKYMRLYQYLRSRGLYWQR